MAQDSIGARWDNFAAIGNPGSAERVHFVTRQQPDGANGVPFVVIQDFSRFNRVPSVANQ